jgi:hypothetical protein
MPVATSVLKSVTEYIDRNSDLDDYEPLMLNVQSIQTQAISSSLLPAHTSTSFAKKAALAQAFSLSHPKDLCTIEPIHTQYPELSLSQMEDAYTMRVPLVAGVEVKERGGSYNEGTVQLGGWCAAGLEKLRRLREEGHEKRIMERGEMDEPPRREGRIGKGMRAAAIRRMDACRARVEVTCCLDECEEECGGGSFVLCLLDWLVLHGRKGGG